MASQLHKYTRVKLLGQGGFGSAHLVTARDDPRKQFVLKEIKLSSNPKEIEAAKGEAELLRRLRHPNIIGYIEHWLEGGGPPVRGGFPTPARLFIVMEYADGGDLNSRIQGLKKAGGYMTEEESLSYLVQICLALKHMHDRRILHRDIKSQNVFLTKTGIVKLGDLGIAKALSSSMDMAKTQIGTPYFLPPEICYNRPYNRKSDIWALGVLLYEMTVLALPFTAPDLPRLVVKIMAATYAPIPARYSAGLRALLDSCLCKDPKARPSVGTILHSEVLQSRIARFLTQTLAAREFGEALKTPAVLEAVVASAAPAAAPKLAPLPAAAPAPAAAAPPVFRVELARPSVEAPPHAGERVRSAGGAAALIARSEAEAGGVGEAAAARRKATEAAGVAALALRKQQLLDLVANQRESERARDGREAAAIARAHEAAREARAKARIVQLRGAGEGVEADLASQAAAAVLEERTRKRRVDADARSAWVAARQAEQERGWRGVDEGAIASAQAREPSPAPPARSGIAPVARAPSPAPVPQLFPSEAGAKPVPAREAHPQGAGSSEAEHLSRLEAARREAFADRQSAAARAAVERRRESGLEERAGEGGGGGGGGGGGPAVAECVRAAARAKREAEAVAHEAMLREAARVQVEERRALGVRARALIEEEGSAAALPLPAAQSAPHPEVDSVATSRTARAAAADAAEAARLAALAAAAREAWEGRRAMEAAAKARAAAEAEAPPVVDVDPAVVFGERRAAPTRPPAPSVEEAETAAGILIFSPGRRPDGAEEATWRPPPLKTRAKASAARQSSPVPLPAPRPSLSPAPPAKAASQPAPARSASVGATATGPKRAVGIALPATERAAAGTANRGISISSERARAALAAIDVAVAEALRLRPPTGAPPKPLPVPVPAAAPASLSPEDEAAVALEVQLAAMREQMQAVLAGRPGSGRSRPGTAARRGAVVLPAVPEEAGPGGAARGESSDGEGSVDSDSEEEEEEEEGPGVEGADGAVGEGTLGRSIARRFSGMPNIATILLALEQADKGGYGPVEEGEEEEDEEADEEAAFRPLNVGTG